MHVPSLISVIIPCYNQAKYLPDALNSVLLQTYDKWECIIINDGSLDNSEAVALEWVEKDRRYKYFNKANGGLSDARNFGIKQSNGEYILPLDADDKISKTYIKEAIEIFETNKEISVVYCEAEFFGNQTGIWYLPKFSKTELLFYNTVFCSAIYKKEDYLKTKGYNINMIKGLEDWDFWLSLIEVGCNFFKIPKVNFFYRIREGSMVRSITEEEQKLMYKQHFLNHVDLYIDILGFPQNAYHQAYKYKKSYFKVTKSIDYRLGHFLVNPFRIISRLIYQRLNFFFLKKNNKELIDSNCIGQIIFPVV